VLIKQDFEKTYEERNKDRVNPAEIKAEEFYKRKGCFITRFGFDEKKESIPSNYFKLIPKNIRNMPEYLVIKNLGDLIRVRDEVMEVTAKSWLVEVKGCRESVRVKLDDLEGYKFWNNICEVNIFVYSFAYNCPYIISYNKLQELVNCKGMATKDKYHDNNKEHYVIPVKNLTLYGFRVQ